MTRVSCKTRNLFRDAHGVAIDDVRFVLPADKLRWPKVTRVQDERVCQFMHERFGACWKCGDSHVEAHHMFAGSKGRSDELCAMAMLCPLHHGQLKEPILPLGEILWLKWKMDWLHTDWTRCVLLHGHFLPDLIVKK